MSTTTVEQAAALSDDDFIAELGNPSFLDSVEQEQQQDDTPTDDDEGEAESQESVEDADTSEEDEGEDSEEAQDLETENDDEQAEESDEDESEQDDSEEDTEEDASNTVSNEVQEFYDAITKPFKANGREMQVKTPQEAIRLMEMGAGAAKRMAELKPNFQILKTLENASLLDADKINHIVDLMKGDQQAIIKLLHDTSFDIDSVDDLETQAQGYKPSDKIVSEKAVEFDEIIATHRNDEGFNKISQDIDSWDNAALQELGNEPTILSHLLNHNRLGIYDKVASEVNRLRALNDASIAGLNALQAYTKVGDILDKQGAFAEQTPAAKPTDNAQAVKDAVKNAVRKRKGAKPAPNKKAAATPRSTPPKKPVKAPSVEDMAKLSDDDFMKQLGL